MSQRPHIWSVVRRGREARADLARMGHWQAPVLWTAADATGDYGECLKDFAYWIGGHGRSA